MILAFSGPLERDFRGAKLDVSRSFAKERYPYVARTQWFDETRCNFNVCTDLAANDFAGSLRQIIATLLSQG